MNKIPELELILKDQNLDVVFITETLPKNYRSNIREAELLVNGYALYGNSSPKRGVYIIVKESLVCDKISYFAEIERKVDILWLKMELQGSDALLLGCEYRSANNTEQQNENILTELIKAAHGHYSHILIAGEFNFPIIDWNTMSTTHDTESIESRFLECMKNCFLHQHVYLPTHLGDIKQRMF